MKIDIENVDKIKISHPEDIFEIIQKVFYLKKDEVDLMKEHLWAFSLNKVHKILNLELVSMGYRDRTIADPSEILRVPLYKSSSYVIIVHNHPSGDLTPRQADIDLTNKLIKAGDLLDIKVLDHVIVSDNSFFSFELTGLIEQLQMDNKYALTFVYRKKMERQMRELKRSVERQKRESRLEGKKEGIKKGEKRGVIKGRKEGLKEGKKIGEEKGEKRGVIKGKKEGLKEGKKIGEEKGIIKGEKSKARKIAKQMLLEGESTQKIMKYTGLIKQWIGRIKNEIKNEQNSN